MPSGQNRRLAARNVGEIFFPQSKSLGIGRGKYSPNLQRKIVYGGTSHGSFELGKQALQELADVKVTTKQVERLTEHIGNERLAQRKKAVAASEALPLTDNHQTPAGGISPKVGVPRADGVRFRDLARVAGPPPPDD